MPGLDFSFAGLKTALLYRVRELGEAESERRRADLAASYQRAIVEALALRVERALQQTGAEQLAVGGGVAANGPLRERLAALGVPVDIPPRELCTDNAAMIASAARYVPPAVPRVPRRSMCMPPASGRSSHEQRPRGASSTAGRLLPVRRRPRDPRARPGHAAVRARRARHRRRRALLRAYLERIPVVAIDGVEVFELFVDEAELARARLSSTRVEQG